eukprot:6211456-Pleurochrysis_carterae.AAC.4
MGMNKECNDQVRSQNYYDYGAQYSTITLPLSAAEPPPQLQLMIAATTVAAASNECMCGDGSLLITTRPVTPTSARLHRHERGREPS